MKFVATLLAIVSMVALTACAEGTNRIGPNQVYVYDDDGSADYRQVLEACPNGGLDHYQRVGGDHRAYIVTCDPPRNR